MTINKNKIWHGMSCMAVMCFGSSAKEYCNRSKMSLICLLLMVPGTYAVKNNYLSGVKIPAVLYEGINPKMPGKVNLIVDQDVISPKSKNIWLPFYTKFLCEYKALKKGQAKLLLRCNEAIRSDGLRVRAKHGKDIAIAEIKTNDLGLIGSGTKIILRPIKDIIIPNEVLDKNVKQLEDSE